VGASKSFSHRAPRRNIRKPLDLRIIQIAMQHQVYLEPLDPSPPSSSTLACIVSVYPVVLYIDFHTFKRPLFASGVQEQRHSHA
jgi:hypothetical protein